MKFFLIAMACLLCVETKATTCVWTNAASGNWQNALNWFPNVVPGLLDTACVTNAGSYTVFITNGSPGVSVSMLIIGGAGSSQVVVAKSSPLVPGNCLINAGGSLIVSNNSTLTPGALFVATGGSLVADFSATITAANVPFTNAGSVFINNYATFAASNCYVAAGGVLAVDGYATLSPTSYFIQAGGTLTLSNAWMAGALTVQTGGVLNCSAPNNSYLYSLTITNHGTVNWNSGGLTIGSTPPTTVINNGLWQINGPVSSSSGGGAQSVWVNNGTLRKVGPTTAGVFDFNFLNQPGGLVDVQGGTLNFKGGSVNPTNKFTGTYNTAVGVNLQFQVGTWSDAGGVFTGGGTNSFSGTTLNLVTNIPANLKLTGGDIWIIGTNTFQNFGAITNLAIDGATLRGTNTVVGTLAFTAGSISEKLIIATNGQWLVSGTANKLIYGATILNQGTATISSGLNAGQAKIINSGLWQITGDYDFNDGANSPAQWTNSGVLRKTAGAAGGFSLFAANFVNLPGGQVETQAGRLLMGYGTNSQFGGTFNTTGILELNNGVWTDAGGVAIGTGTNRFVGGTFNFRTNTIPGLLLAGGNIFITSTNTFQNFGAITNLTLDGATLSGTNIVSGGTLTMNAGSLNGQLLVLPDGQLTFATSASKFISPLSLSNRGTVTLGGSGVSSGNTTINNLGLWQMPGDFGLAYGGVGTAAFTNSGTFRKTSGSGTADNTSVKFVNQPGALVQVDAGTLLLPATSTNLTGTLRLNGGTLGAHFSGVLNVAGGTLDGAGTVGANYFSGGNLSPGQGGAGLMNFSAGLNLNSNVTLFMDGSGTVPGTSYDQFNVTGTVVLSNCNLAITALPVVPAGTTFIIIANDGADAVQGTFNGLPENFLFNVGAQPFRIHYAGGTGNDVTLVRSASAPTLGGTSLTNGVWNFTGAGTPSGVYAIQATANFITWTNLGFATGDVSGNLIFTDTNAFRFKYRFYRTTN